MSQSVQLFCSTGALGRYPDYTSYQAILQYAPQLEVDGFELMFYANWYSDLERIASALQHSALKFPAMHMDKNIGTVLGNADAAVRARGVQLFAENCRLGSYLGTTLLVLHLWNWPGLDDNLEYNLQPLHECLDIAAQHGQLLAIETIPGRRFDPLTNVRSAREYDERCQIALDSEFLARYNQLTSVFETDWLWTEQRVKHVHIKDYDGQPHSDGKRRYLHPGEGDIDFARFFAHLKQHNFVGAISQESPAIYENGEVNVQQLRTNLEFIRQFLW